MNINEMSITELKALSYDFIVEIERLQQNLRVVQARINELSQENNKPAKEKDVQRKSNNT